MRPGLLLALPLAGMVTMALFRTMHWMVLLPSSTLSASEDLREIEYLRLQPLEREPAPRTRPRSPPPRPSPPPPRPPRNPSRSPPPQAPAPLPIPPPQFARFQPESSLLDLGSAHLDHIQMELPAPLPLTAPPEALIPVLTVPPRYPPRARRTGLEGWVRLIFTVTLEGSVEDIEVEQAEPPGVFESAAKKAVSRWRFRPRRGVPGEDPDAGRRRVRQVLRFQREAGSSS